MSIMMPPQWQIKYTSNISHFLYEYHILYCCMILMETLSVNPYENSDLEIDLHGYMYFTKLSFTVTECVFKTVFCLKSNFILP